VVVGVVSKRKEKNHLRLAFGCEGGGGGGCRVETTKVTTSGSHLDAREVAGEGRRNGRKRATTFVVARFRDALLGPPTSWVPPRVSPPPTPCWLTSPHPSEEGRGGCGWRLLMALQVEVNQQRDKSGHVQKRDASHVIMSVCTNIIVVRFLLSPTTYLRLPPPSPVPLPQKMWAGFGNAPQRLSNNMDAGLRLPLPSPSALPRHSTSSVENASPGLLPPSSLPRHLTLSVEDASPGLPLPSHPPLCHVTRRRASRTPWSATALLSATSLDVERRGCLPGLPLPSHPPLCHVTQRRALRTPLVCHCPPLCHITSHLALRTPPPTCHCPIKSPATPRNTL
jgi:hypothetical protein